MAELTTIKTEIVFPTATVRLTHEPTTVDPGRVGQGVCITEEGVTPNTFTTLEVRRGGAASFVYLLWRPESWHLNLSVLFVPETSILFVGGGTFSATVDLNSMKVVHQHQVCLFWSFQYAPRSILELGEIQCFLYRLNGELVGSVDVDPPYDVVQREHGFEFVTSLHGTSYLAFPS